MPKYSHPYKPNSGGAADTPQDGAQNVIGRFNHKVEEIDRRTDEFSRSIDDIVSDLAGVGAGVAVNRIVQQTNAAVNGSQMNVKDLMVHANGTPRIENVGVGIAAAGQGAGVAGSVSVNMIDNDVTAHIGSGANINANGSVGVVAKSDEQISNYAGQVAVGAVVMNRVKSSSFPNTISGVIYQSGAFDAVRDGQINLSPDSTAKKAAQDAINGWDPSYGAIYYFNPSTATNKWIWSRPMTVTIGRHRFCK